MLLVFSLLELLQAFFGHFVSLDAHLHIVRLKHFNSVTFLKLFTFFLFKYRVFTICNDTYKKQMCLYTIFKPNVSNWKINDGITSFRINNRQSKVWIYLISNHNKKFKIWCVNIQSHKPRVREMIWRKCYTIYFNILIYIEYHERMNVILNVIYRYILHYTNVYESNIKYCINLEMVYTEYQSSLSTLY